MAVSIKTLRTVAVYIGAGLLALALYAADGWRDAQRDTPRLEAWANALMDQGRGPEGLTDWQTTAFLRLHGADDTAGATTNLANALAERLAFKDAQPVIAPLRQVAYGQALASTLSDEQLMTLAMDQAPMGRVEGRWVTGLHDASERYFEKPVDALEEREFIALMAVMSAPGEVSLSEATTNLDDRIIRLSLFLLDGPALANAASPLSLEGYD